MTDYFDSSVKLPANNEKVLVYFLGKEIRATYKELNNGTAWGFVMEENSTCTLHDAKWRYLD